MVQLTLNRKNGKICIKVFRRKNRGSYDSFAQWNVSKLDIVFCLFIWSVHKQAPWKYMLKRLFQMKVCHVCATVFLQLRAYLILCRPASQSAFTSAVAVSPPQLQDRERRCAAVKVDNLRSSSIPHFPILSRAQVLFHLNFNVFFRLIYQGQGQGTGVQRSFQLHCNVQGLKCEVIK